MKRYLTLFLSLVAMGSSIAYANQVQLDFLPSSQNVLIGGNFQVGVGISLLNIGGPPSLGAYDLNLLFDPARLSFISAAFGDPLLGDQLDLFSLGSIQSVSTGAGLANLFELSLDSEADINAFQAGDFTLFTVTFSALAEGTSTLNLAVNALSDAAGVPITSIVNEGSVTIASDTNVVPEPSMLVPIVVGLALVLLQRTLKR